MTSSEIVAAICPELASSPALPVFLKMAQEVLDAGFFGKLFSYAIAYQACHFWTLSGGAENGGAAGAAAGLGQIASMSEGGLSVTFATSQGGTAATAELDTTKYGKLLLGLIKTRPTMGVNTAGLP